MADITLWHVPMSRSVRVMWLLEELGLDYRLQVLSLLDGAMRKPPYDTIHPGGRVPALQIDGMVLHESGAMIEYLCETHGPSLWRAPGAAGRGPWLDWLHLAETLGQHLANLTQQHIVLREDWQRSATVMQLEAARLARVLNMVEAAVLDRDWLLGGFSGVDCAVGYSVDLARRFVSFEGRPALAAYRDRVAARPAFQRCQPKPGDDMLYRRAFYEVPNA